MTERSGSGGGGRPPDKADAVVNFPDVTIAKKRRTQPTPADDHRDVELETPATSNVEQRATLNVAQASAAADNRGVGEMAAPVKAPSQPGMGPETAVDTTTRPAAINPANGFGGAARTTATGTRAANNDRSRGPDSVEHRADAARRESWGVTAISINAAGALQIPTRLRVGVLMHQHATHWKSRQLEKSRAAALP